MNLNLTCWYAWLSVVWLTAEAAFEGGKWGDRPRPRSRGGPAFQA